MAGRAGASGEGYQLTVSSLGGLINLATIRDAFVEVRVLISSRPLRAARRRITGFAGRKSLGGQGIAFASDFSRDCQCGVGNRVQRDAGQREQRTTEL